MKSELGMGNPRATHPLYETDYSKVFGAGIDGNAIFAGRLQV